MTCDFENLSGSEPSGETQDEPRETRLLQLVREACRIEVIAEKPGNVSLSTGFEDATAADFLRSADVVAPVIARACTCGVGWTILEAIRATRDAVGHNTNLGIVLLLTPLAAVHPDRSIADGIGDTLNRLTVADAELTYRAINLAMPAGLGHVENQDVAAVPTEDLRSCMALAADRDIVAAQYENGFRDVLAAAQLLVESRSWSQHQEKRLAWVALKLMAEFGDSLIRRKCGDLVNQQVQLQACDLLRCDWPFRGNSDGQYRAFDGYLRADGHQRNPGTTADLIAGALFVALREGWCQADEFIDDVEFRS